MPVRQLRVSTRTRSLIREAIVGCFPRARLITPGAETRVTISPSRVTAGRRKARNDFIPRNRGAKRAARNRARGARLEGAGKVGVNGDGERADTGLIVELQ